MPLTKHARAGAADHRDVVVRLDATLGHLLRRAQQVHTAIWLAEFDGEVTGPQCGLLLEIFRNEPLDQTAVGRLVSLDRSTAGDVIARLVRRGWVVRTRDPSDGRRNTLTLTPAARDAVDQMARRAVDVQDRLMAPVPPAERPWLIENLAKLAYAGRLPAAPSGDEAPAEPPRLHTLPGHLIRRAERVHDAHWADLVGSRITPSQYGLMTSLASELLVDQRQAGALASLDRSSTSNIAARLVRRGLIEKEVDDRDRRRTLLRLSADGWDLMKAVAPAVQMVQSTVAEPLSECESARLIRLLRTVAYRGRPVEEKVSAV